MKTSNFKIYKGDQGVAICLYPPLDWFGAQFPALEPPRSLFFARKADQIDDKEYERQYREQVLKKLNPREVYETLRGQVLLCGETPGEFCHRRIVADWIKEELGYDVPEWQPGDDDEKINIHPLF